MTLNIMPKKILIIEDERGLAEMYKLKFEKEGYIVLIAGDGESGIKIAREELPDLVLLDIVMPGLDGFDVLRTLRSDYRTENLKIFVFSNLGQDDEIERGLQEGADKYLIKANLTPGQLLQKIEEAFLADQMEGKKDNKPVVSKNNFKDLKQEVKADAAKILLIEDENDIITMYDLCLNREGYNVDIARNGAWGLKLAREKSYDLIVMDMVMPAMSGLELLKKLKAESLHQNIPILVVSNSAQDKDIEEAKAEGATDYLLKASLTPANLIKEIKKYLR
ncbi:MAG: Transcriptional regulatory protein AfsQ1 [Parcubacteria group bacterium ADurb.Bin316]|nr:MAG: Transcriptional regulatory protein AfsQ1 [Parcubacteria group bacterium ADurb.Bin316]